MITPLTTSVRCDAPTGKDGDRCKASFALVMANFSAVAVDVIAAAREIGRGWYLNDRGGAFCPACVLSMLGTIERLEDEAALKGKSNSPEKGRLTYGLELPVQDLGPKLVGVSQKAPTTGIINAEGGA